MFPLLKGKKFTYFHYHHKVWGTEWCLSEPHCVLLQRKVLILV